MVGAVSVGCGWGRARVKVMVRVDLRRFWSEKVYCLGLMARVCELLDHRGW